MSNYDNMGDDMKVSELIKKMQEIIKEHGDIKVYLDDWNEGYREPFPMNMIWLDEKESAKRIILSSGQSES